MNGKNFYYQDASQKEIGPFQIEALVKLRFAGVLEDATPVRLADQAEWQPLSAIVLAHQSDPPAGAMATLPTVDWGALKNLTRQNAKFLIWTRLALFSLAVLCFFFTFFTVTAPGLLRGSIYSFTGWELVTGTQTSTRNDWTGAISHDKIPADPKVILALVSSLLAVGSVFLRGRFGTGISTVAGTVSLSLLLMVKWGMSHEAYRASSGGMRIEGESAYVLCCLFVLVGVLFSIAQALWASGGAAQAPAFGAFLSQLAAAVGHSTPTTTPTSVPVTGAETAAPSPHPQPSFSFSPKVKWAALAVLLFAGIGAGAWFFLNQLNRTPPAKEISALIQQKFGGSAQRLSSVSTELADGTNPRDITLAFSATMELMEPIYLPVSANDWLASQGADPALFDRFDLFFSSPRAARLRSLTGITGSEETLKKYRLLKESAPKGTSYAITGKIRATRYGKKWQLKLDQASTEQKPAGLPLSQYEGIACFIDRPEDSTKLKQLLKKIQDAVERLTKAEATLIEEDRVAQQKRAEEALASITPGLLFSGTVNTGGSGQSPIYLEITEVNRDRGTVTALLRNDGGWNEARRFQGAFNYDAAQEAVLLNLSTKEEDCVPDCGPILQLRKGWTFSFRLNGDTLSAKSGNYDYELKRVSDSEKEALIGRAREEEIRWLKATTPGKAYRVYATISKQAWNQDYIFVFTRQERNGVLIEGSLAQPGIAGKRHFRGTLVANRYKADGKPLRLMTDLADRIAGAPEENGKNLLAHYNHFEFYPKLDGERFVFDAYFMGIGSQFHFEFEPISNEEAEKRVGSPAAVPQASATPPSQPAPPATPTAAATLVPATPTAAIALIQKAESEQPSGTIVSGGIYMGFMCKQNGSNLEAVSLRVQSVSGTGRRQKVQCLLESVTSTGAKRQLSGQLINGYGLDLTTDDALGRKPNVADLLLGSVKVNGSSVNDSPASDAPKTGNIFEGGVCQIVFLMKPSGLFGAARETDRFLLLKPAL